MKKIIIKFIKCIILYIVIFMILLSGVSYGYSSAEVGQAVAGYTLNLLKWGNEENLADGGPRLRYTQSGVPPSRLSHPTLSNPDPELPWYYDCSSFACAMYNMVCNKEIIDWGGTTVTIGSSSSFDNLGPQSSANKHPGDLICNPNSHVEVYISSEYGTGGAHSNGARSN